MYIVRVRYPLIIIQCRLYAKPYNMILAIRHNHLEKIRFPAQKRGQEQQVLVMSTKHGKKLKLIPLIKTSSTFNLTF